MGRRFLTAAALALALAAPAKAAERLVLVTIDGLSWTEVFRGANPERAGDRAFVSEPGEIRSLVETPDRATALMPFLHGVVAKRGVVIGDRDHGSCLAVANDKWFSYPGYNEILTGRPDPEIKSNEHGPNANVTILEWLNRQPGFKARVQAVTSWSAFRNILNVQRSGLPVDSGWDGQPRGGEADVTRAAIARDLPHLWPTARFDALTQSHALQALKRDKPRVLYVSFNDTDDFAHEGHYDQVLLAAQRADRFVSELWQALQADPAYAGKTNLIVTVDHGRGTETRDSWRHHGRPFIGSDGTWFAALGPDVRAGGATNGACASSSQIAATALSLLGLDWKRFDPGIPAPLPVVGGR